MFFVHIYVGKSHQTGNVLTRQAPMYPTSRPITLLSTPLSVLSSEEQVFVFSASTYSVFSTKPYPRQMPYLSV